jgi:Periplasmic copper-binding protein (NosD)
MRITRGAGAALAVALLAPASAMAVTYPPPSDPGSPSKPPKHTHTLKVCKQKKCRYHRIQKAINHAKQGDTVKVANGTYREGLKISGRKKAFLRLIGNPKNPRKVVLEGKGLHGSPAQNGVQINGANHVTINGFHARHYRGNGFFAVNVDGYTLTHLIAEQTGVYGIYAFNSRGGTMTNSEAYYNNDSGFYIGQTPPQVKPKRSIVKNVKSWGNVLGFSGTNMRYVTITKSEWFNNGLGIVPNALDSEKYAPPEDNVITDNDVFWNNFNYFAGAPFKVGKTSTGFDFPPGIGILLFGSRTTQVTNNRVYGNFLLGMGVVQQFVLKQQDAALPIGNVFSGNDMGLGGSDLNGRDMAYDGSGSKNCFENNTLRSPNVPADNNTFATCPGPDPNHADGSVLAEGANWIGDDTHEKYWIRHDHAAHKGYNPLEHWAKGFKPGGGL